MLNHIIKRLLSAIPILLGVSFLTYFLLTVVPGDPVTLMMGEKLKPEIVDRITRQMHLDDPFLVRYGKFLADALRGDLGFSYKFKRSVSSLIIKAFPNTLILACSAALVAWIIGIPVGIISAIKKNKLADHMGMGFALFGVSVPVFWSGLLLQYIFGLKLGWLPIAGFNGLDIRYLILPSFVLGWSSAGSVARLTRSSLLEVMNADYIRTAWQKGLLRPQVIVRHALKNSFLPVITVMALQIAFLLSGSVITESIFGIPGLGRIAVNAIQQRDMPLLLGSVIFTTILVIIGNIAADILYSFIDPRIRYNKKD